MFMILLPACTSYRNIQRIGTGEVGIGLSVVEDRLAEPSSDEETVIDSIRGTLSDGPIIMNAIRDSETGEMVATDVINASKVTARFRNVAERGGYVTICFDVSVPETMLHSDWQLKIYPHMKMMQDTVDIDPIFITGSAYRNAQLRGYQRYRAFVASIITDTTDLFRMGQLDIFIERYFPATYAMKNDSSIVPEPLAANLFGVTQREAAEHYRRHWKTNRNEWKKKNSARLFRKYVKDPIVEEGIRLDTVMTANGGFVHRYNYTFKSMMGLRKVHLFLTAQLFQKGQCRMEIPFSDELTFYISSLSSLVDERTKYRVVILERTVYDHTKALIDFKQGSAALDTCLSDNASELTRLRRCIGDVRSQEGLVLDSLVIVASCSPEGSYQINKRLSQERAESMRRYVSEYIPSEWIPCLKISELPENWTQLRILVQNDTVMGNVAVKRIMKLTQNLSDPDVVERRLAELPQYRYLREKMYPKLRSVNFEFYLHRQDMVKDTVHTTEVDTVYMSGVEALKNLDYKTAVARLRQYGDFNSALACVSADYNHSAFSVLEKLNDADPKVCYLKALVLSRLEQDDEALKYLKLCISYDPYMRFRANLDPEMSVLVQKLEDEL